MGDPAATQLDSANLTTQTDGGLRAGDCAAACALHLRVLGQATVATKTAATSMNFHEPLIVQGTSWNYLKRKLFGAGTPASDDAPREAAAMLAQSSSSSSSRLLSCGK